MRGYPTKKSDYPRRKDSKPSFREMDSLAFIWLAANQFSYQPFAGLQNRSFPSPLSRWLSASLWGILIQPLRSLFFKKGILSTPMLHECWYGKINSVTYENFLKVISFNKESPPIWNRVAGSAKMIISINNQK